MKYLAALAFAVFVARAEDVSGVWKVEGDIGTAHVSRVCTLKQSGDKLEGGCKNAQNEVTLTGSVAEKNVTWQYTVTFQGQTFPLLFKGTVESAGSIKGKMQIPGEALVQAGDFTATRQH